MAIIYNKNRKKGLFYIPAGGLGPSVSAAFAYSKSSFNQAEADPTPTITGTAGGTFNASSGLVFVDTGTFNSSTGQIDLSASTIDSHIITYTVDGVQSGQTVGITAAPYQSLQMQFEVASGVSETITILGVSGSSFFIDWGDGFTETNTGGGNRAISHTYNDGTYNDVTNPTVSIGSESDTGPLNRLKFRGGSGPELLDIKNWGQSQWTHFGDAFRTCNNPAFQISATNTPDLSLLTASSSYFTTMFFQSTINSSNLINWDISNIKKFDFMFFGASQFNQDISGWNVANATSMQGLFLNAFSFNQDISGWDVSNVENFKAFVQTATSFNQDISGWNVSNVENLRETFQSASSFNQDISSWDVSSATTMHEMFRSASSFNQDISGWNTSLVTDMQRVFQSASVFNQNLNSWNVSNVTNMLAMFFQASNFNQNLSDWQITSLSDARFMFNSSAMTTENYTDTIVGWAVYVYNNSGVPSSVNMTSNSKTFDGTRTTDNASSQTYAAKYGSNWTATGWTNSQDAFDYLTTTLSWTIN